MTAIKIIAAVGVVWGVADQVVWWLRAHRDATDAGAVVTGPSTGAGSSPCLRDSVVKEPTP